MCKMGDGSCWDIFVVDERKVDSWRMGGRDLLQSQNRVSGRCLAVGMWGTGVLQATADCS